jgi:hypothetical protein
MLSPRCALVGLLIAVSLSCDSPKSTLVAPDATLDLRALDESGVRVYQFRTEEDPTVTGANDFCATAPFHVNVKLNASAWSVRTRAADGQVVNQDAKRVGTALACAQLTNFAFPAGLQQNFYARFQLPSGSYTALGTCTLISNKVPVAGLVLAGCTLALTEMPASVIGGAAVSLSVFNPRRLPGFATGSYWTIQAYDRAAYQTR